MYLTNISIIKISFSIYFMYIHIYLYYIFLKDFV